MRSTPVLAVNAVGNFGVSNSAGASVVITAFANDQASTYTPVFYVTVASGLIAGNGTVFWANNNTNARLTATADI
jgi:hypothetical protein